MHAFLIRSPVETIASYYRLNPEVRAEQIGFGHQLEIFEAVRAATGRAPFVMDAGQLIGRPGRRGRRLLRGGRHRVPAGRADLAAGPPVRVGTVPALARGRQPHHWLRRRPVAGGASELVAGNDRLAAILDHQQPFYQRLRVHAVSGRATR